MSRGKLRSEQVHAGIEILRSYFDHIIIDLPHELNATVTAAVEASNTIFYLVNQNVSALRLGNAGLSALRELEYDLKKVRLVLVRERTEDDVTLKQVREMLSMPIYWTLPNDHSTVVTAINHGQPVIMARPRSKIGRSLRQLSDTLADQHSRQASEKWPALLTRLCGNFGFFSQGTK
jgi:pilus assembly protein CpaE